MTHGGIIGCVSIREEEEGLLDRGWEKEEILKLEEGEPGGASHKHSSSSSCIEFRLFIHTVHNNLLLWKGEDRKTKEYESWQLETKFHPHSEKLSFI